MLNSTDCPVIMIETFFCDNKSDYDIATKLGYGEVAKLIAEGILNKSIVSEMKLNHRHTTMQ
jgi:N-acetylmuramoyl-L-alanine amidase